jgi:hypothetical protein
MLLVARIHIQSSAPAGRHWSAQTAHSEFCPCRSTLVGPDRTFRVLPLPVDTGRPRPHIQSSAPAGRHWSAQTTHSEFCPCRSTLVGPDHHSAKKATTRQEMFGIWPWNNAKWHYLAWIWLKKCRHSSYPGRTLHIEDCNTCSVCSQAHLEQLSHPCLQSIIFVKKKHFKNIKYKNCKNFMSVM